MYYRLQLSKSYNFDVLLLQVVIILTAIGLIMVASSSVPIAEKFHLAWYHFIIKQALYIFLGIILLILFSIIKINYLEKYSIHSLIISIMLLILVLLPGIGHNVNGSYRWLGYAGFYIQPSEIAKLTVLIYISGYIIRRNYNLHNNIKGFLLPIVVLMLVNSLLLFEPDFGSAFIITTITLIILFLSGVNLFKFIPILGVAMAALITIAISSPYRIARILSFKNPWDDPFAKGYQLVQALIAFGNGGIFGRGLGNSIQKLLYLPEAHSDFIFAIISEEMGLVGAALVIILYSIFTWRGFVIAKTAHRHNCFFASLLAYSITLYISTQAVLNIAVNMGLLPAKGLTLPLISAGGSSLLVSFISIGILFRIDFENRLKY